MSAAWSAAGQRRRAPDRLAACAGLPSTSTSTRSVTSGSGLAGDRVLELPLDAPRDEPQGELAQRRQVRLGEEPVERDLRSRSGG